VRRMRSNDLPWRTCFSSDKYRSAFAASTSGCSVISFSIHLPRAISRGRVPSYRVGLRDNSREVRAYCEAETGFESSLEIQMMIVPILCAAVAFQDVSLKEYTSPTTDMRLKYPSNWSLKKDRYADELRFKVDGKDVYVELMGIEMNFPAQHWQDVTREINTNNDRAVLRQWEEELLGVPLLLTKVRDMGKAEIEISITGLILSNRTQKMLFRLHAPESVAPSAEEQWNKVMLSADTISGKLPSESAPTTTPENGGGSATVSTTPGRVQIIEPKIGPPKTVKRGSVRMPLDVDRGTFLYLNEGWDMKEGTLSNGSTLLQFGQGIGEERVARSEWLKVCGSALGRLNTITGRVEPEPKYRESGFRGSFLERRGTTADGSEVQWVAYGWMGGYFYTLNWAGTELEFKSTKEAREKLLESLAIAAE